MKIRPRKLTFFLLFFVHTGLAVAQELEWSVGLSTNRDVIFAQGVQANSQSAPTVLYIGGLEGEADSSELIRTLSNAYSQLNVQNRPLNLITIPLANPDEETLSFPPSGKAYSDDPASNSLWRWIGVHAPDLVIVAGDDKAGLSTALSEGFVASTGAIPVLPFSEAASSIGYLLSLANIQKSPAREELERRINRTPEELAQQLAESYGYDFSSPVYVPGMSLIGRLRLGGYDEVAQLIQEYLREDAIEISNASLMAGHLVFAEYAERTGNEDALRLAISAANLAFDEQKELLEAMPFHSEMSDSVFMATPLLVKVGKLTGDTRYFDMAVRHVEFMQNLLLRDDGLYRHSPLSDVAWGRGNAFPALGLALSLSDIPVSHPGYEIFRTAFLEHLEALQPYQDIDGMWRQVIDYQGSFAELSATAMIGIAIKRGLDQNLLSGDAYRPILDKIWNAVSIRTSFSGEFMDVCTSTGKLSSLDAYLDRLAIFGRDDRAGGMVMNLAIEMADIR